MENEENVLMVKHLPSELSDSDCVDLLKHFGGEQVRVMSRKGRLKHTAFVMFPDHDSAHKALNRLHQLDVLGSRLVAEYSKPQDAKFHPQVNENWPEATKEDLETESRKQQQEKAKQEKMAALEAEKEFKEKLARKLNSISSTWGCDYPYNPRLTYLYPPPTETTLMNISNALATVPKFYVQVLHLMNKMCLPAPFGPLTPCPPLVNSVAPPPLPADESAPPLPTKPYPPDGQEESSEESEIESEGDESGAQRQEMTAVKRPAPKRMKPPKRPKLSQMIAPPKIESKPVAVKPSEVFEEVNVSSTKSFQFNLPSALSEEVDVNDQVSSLKVEELGSEQEGFGKMLPVAKDFVEKDQGEADEWGSTEFISSRQLKKGRLSRSEMKDYSVFKNYSAGEPTSRLYVKNVAKAVTEKDLHYIFGKYVNWDDEIEKNMFDIRLMKEGRMKGQAFVTLPNEEAAKDALESTHGFMLHDKPLVVQFARSAKPKAKEETDKKGSK